MGKVFSNPPPPWACVICWVNAKICSQSLENYFGVAISLVWFSLDFQTSFDSLKQLQQGSRSDRRQKTWAWLIGHAAGKHGCTTCGKVKWKSTAEQYSCPCPLVLPTGANCNSGAPKNSCLCQQNIFPYSLLIIQPSRNRAEQLQLWVSNCYMITVIIQLPLPCNTVT